ncbi:MAG TPA: GAF domain-containing protein [Polyangiaceae bacterium]|nr:GAF domain-containing protein [Polyangiaceae bacterium]
MDEGGRQQFSEIAAAIGEFTEASADYPRLIETIVRSMARVCGGFCSISLISQDSTYLEPAAKYDHDPEARALIEQISLVGPVPLKAESPAAQVIRTGSPFVTRSVTNEILRARFPPASWPLLERLAIKSLMQVPVRSQGQVIGVLTLNRHGENAVEFDEFDLAVAQQVADHAALSLVNAKRFDEARRINQRLSLVSQAAQEFSEATSDLSGLFEVVTRRLSGVLGGLCVLRLLSDDGAYLDPHATAGGEESVEIANVTHQVARWRADEGLPGHIVETGQSILIERANATALTAKLSVERTSLLRQMNVSSAIGTPLVVRGKVIGTLTASRRGSEAPYAKEDLELLQDLAAYASLAISNGQLLESARSELAERKRAEAALGQLEDQLRQAQKLDAVGKLAGGVAHDFNNLLSVILSYSALLAEQFAAGDERLADLLEIRRAAERAAALTQQLLAFSRQQVASLRLVDMNDLIRGVSRMFETVLGEHVSLSLLLDPDLGQVRADPGQLEQVLMNLVVNARDAMPDGGALAIETASAELDDSYAAQHLGVVPGPHVMFAVSDTGIGMDRATQARIFEPFFTTKELGKGTGLGLSTTFGIVKQNGGSIWVYSELGRGTTFKVYLPRVFDAERPPPTSLPPTCLSGNETILLVEDQDQVRTVASAILATRGYRVLVAEGGDAALALSATYEGEIQLLLTDVVMPGIGGPVLAERLSKERPELRVLYTSGYTQGAIVQQGLLDADPALLQKPFTPDSLLRKVREVLSA